MRFRAGVSELRAAVVAADRVRAQRSSLHILSSVRITALPGAAGVTIEATDLDVRLRYDVTAWVEEAGSLCVDVARLRGILERAQDDDAHLLTTSSIGSFLRFEMPNGAVAELAAEAGDEFPDELSGAASDPWLSPALMPALVRALPFASDSEHRPILNGIYLHKRHGQAVVVAAQGSYLLARTLEEAAPDWLVGGLIIPRKAVRVAQAIGGASEFSLLAAGERSTPRFRIAGGRWSIDTRLIEGPYPNYDQVLPTEFEHEAIVEVEALRSAIQRALPAATIERNERMIFRLETDRLTVGATGVYARYREDVPCSYWGNGFEINANGSYMLKALAEFEGSVRLRMNTPHMAIVFDQAEHTGHVALVMPLQILDDTRLLPELPKASPVEASQS